MKLSINRILPPEEGRGTRGHPEAIRLGKVAHEMIHHTENGRIALVSPPPQPDIPMQVLKAFEMELKRNPITLNRYILEKYWLQEKGRVYYFPKKFTAALQKTKLTIAPQYLPDRFIGYLAYPEETLQDGVNGYSGAYVYCTKATPEAIVTEAVTEEEKKTITHIVKFVFLEDPQQTVASLSAYIFDGQTIEHSLQRAADMQSTQTNFYTDDGQSFTAPESELIIATEPSEQYYHSINLLMNSLCYVTCLEPNIQHLQPEKQLSRSQKKQARPLRNYCTIPVKLVNWNFEIEQAQRERNLRGDAWEVTGHMRWQPYGPGKQQVKPIWIDPYEKKWRE